MLVSRSYLIIRLFFKDQFSYGINFIGWSFRVFQLNLYIIEKIKECFINGKWGQSIYGFQFSFMVFIQMVLRRLVGFRYQRGIQKFSRMYLNYGGLIEVQMLEQAFYLVYLRVVLVKCYRVWRKVRNKRGLIRE